jgi:hypothetical protein
MKIKRIKKELMEELDLAKCPGLAECDEEKTFRMGYCKGLECALDLILEESEKEKNE